MSTRPLIDADVVEGHKRARIRKAILAQVGQLGYSETRINHIVRKEGGGAGVSRAIFYRNYSGKEAAFVAALEEVVGTLTERIENVSGWRPALEVLAAWVEAEPAEAVCLLLEAPGLQPELYNAAFAKAIAATGLREPVNELVVGGVASILQRYVVGLVGGVAKLDVDGLVAFCEPHFEAQRQTPPAG